MEVNTNELPKNSEQWAAIDGYKNYQVSWWGRVRNATTARILKSKLNPNGYMSVNLSKRDSKPKTHFIHQLVAREWAPNPEQKRCVDHIDGSRTNNHWENLRYATHSENQRNKRRRKDGSSLYKGVSWDKRSGKWVVRIKAQGVYKNLGLFEIEKEAAEVYNAAALKFYKKFARLNELD
jgi:hypothetical protein